MSLNRPTSFRLALLAGLLSLPLVAQAPAPDAGTLALAKQLVAKVGAERDQTLARMGAPMVGMMQQMGITDPAKARVLVDEAIMPLLRDHFDAFVAIQATSYAQLLSADDLKAILAFYNTKAGQDLIKAQPSLAQAQLQGMTQWMGTLQPEMQARIQQISKAHGWSNG